VLVIDMLNAYRHPDADRLASNTADIIEPLTELIARARTDENVDVVYVNDNYGDFTAGFAEIVRSARNGARPDLVEPTIRNPSSATTRRVLAGGDADRPDRGQTRAGRSRLASDSWRSRGTHSGRSCRSALRCP
jgi:nicotinamidase-related amidase